MSDSNNRTITVMEFESGKLYRYIGVAGLNVYPNDNLRDGTMTLFELKQNDWFMFVLLSPNTLCEENLVPDFKTGHGNVIQLANIRVVKIMNHEFLGYILVKEDENMFLPHTEETC